MKILPSILAADYLRLGEVLPVTDRLARRGMNLPTFPGLANSDIARIADNIRKAAARSSKLGLAA